MFNRKKKQIKDLKDELSVTESLRKDAISKLDEIKSEEITIITKDKIITGSFLKENLYNDNEYTDGNNEFSIQLINDIIYKIKIKPKRIVDKQTGNIKIYSKINKRRNNEKCTNMR